jgi:MFS family permease
MEDAAGVTPRAGLLPGTVKTLGWASLLTDLSSEMIYPLLPAFLTRTLGAGPLFVGLLEGVAEAVATAFKVLSGRVSDRLGRRQPLIVAGYTLSSLARPLVAAALAPWHVLAVRFLDRVGKGTRSAPRDALLSAVTPASERGRVFGFQRAMDHAGAMVGPLVASALLAGGLPLRAVFALAAVPAAACVLLLIFRLREEARAPAPGESRAPASAAAPSPHGFRAYLAVLGLFALGNSSDAFLLLRAQDAGVGLAAIPLLWTFHHLVKSAASTPCGALSDRLGRRRTIVAGWAVYAAAYAGFAWASGAVQVVVLFAVYGLFHALTEGPERALVADFVGPAARGRAFGWYHAVTGGLMLPASLLTGALWQELGPAPALLTGSGLAALSAVGLVTLVPEPPSAPGVV